MTSMKISVRALRVIIREAIGASPDCSEAVSASEDYMRKEAVRARIQELVTDMVAKGEIRSDADLADFWRSVEMSVVALRMVPVRAFLKR